MPRSAKLGWNLRTIAVPLLLSLVLHGLLLLALWFWPMRTRSPALTIESTRITIDTCVLDTPSSTLLPEGELPADLRGSIVQATLAPQLLDAPPRPSTSEMSVPPQQKTGETPAPPAGGGSGGGNLFPLPATAGSVVYVLDRSVSMGLDRKLDFARRELIASLRRLPPSAHFQVIDYNDYAEPLVIDGQRGLLPAEPTIISKVISLLLALDAAGKTNHLAALCCGLDLHPDVLYFLTDADDLRPEEVAAVTQRNRGSVIHTIELTHRHTSQPDGPLARLAHDNHGSYRCVSLSSD
jgi:hypothetical protein